MTWFLLGIVATLAAETVGLGAARLLAKRGPVNIVGGVLLPHPQDERWTRQSHHVFGVGSVTYFELGPVTAWESGRLQVAGVTTKASKPYCRAVVRAYVERKALEAV